MMKTNEMLRNELVELMDAICKADENSPEFEELKAEYEAVEAELVEREDNWYAEALESTITEQQEEIGEMEAAIAYMENSKDKSELHFGMLAEMKKELAEAIEDLKSAMQYVESQKQYA